MLPVNYTEPPRLASVLQKRFRSTVSTFPGFLALFLPGTCLLVGFSDQIVKMPAEVLYFQCISIELHPRKSRLVLRRVLPEFHEIIKRMAFFAEHVHDMSRTEVSSAAL